MQQEGVVPQDQGRFDLDFVVQTRPCLNGAWLRSEEVRLPRIEQTGGRCAAGKQLDLMPCLMHGCGHCTSGYERAANWWKESSAILSGGRYTTHGIQ